MLDTKTYCELSCKVISKDNNLDAAVLVTLKINHKNNTADIELYGDGPNNKAVRRLKDVVSTALTESINQYKAERDAAKAKQEAK